MKTAKKRQHIHTDILIGSCKFHLSSTKTLLTNLKYLVQILGQSSDRLRENEKETVTPHELLDGHSGSRSSSELEH